MMREILFRGKRKDNGEWIYGYYCKYGFTGQVKHYIIPDCASALYSYEVIPESVSEFTDLFDNNRKRIFEGDIVKYKDTDGIKVNGVALTIIGKVNYNEKKASFAIDGKDKIGAKHYDYFPIKNIEVIGNIHDNPELVGGADNGNL